MVIDWTPALITHNKRIDDDHKFIIGKLRELSKLLHKPLPESVAGAFLEECGSHFSHHFYDEEMLMLASGYPDLSRHRKDHQNIMILFQKVEEKNYRKALSNDDLFKFIDTLVGHFRFADIPMAAHLR